MKFQHGDNLDVDLSIALKHEFLRCEDAFYDFVETGEQLRRKGPIQGRWKAKNKNDVKRWLAFKRYNAYSRFVHHLYEFLIGAMKRDASDTGQIQALDADIWIQKMRSVYWVEDEARSFEAQLPSGKTISATIQNSFQWISQRNFGKFEM